MTTHKKAHHVKHKKVETNLCTDEHCTEDHGVSTLAPSAKKEFSTSNGLIAVVGILILMSAVQVVQTKQLLSAVSNGNLKATSAPAQGSSIGLPSQVGGCG